MDGTSATETYLRSIRELCPDLTKKEVFVAAGEVQKHLGFIAQGLVRSFYIDGDGNERTVGF